MTEKACYCDIQASTYITVSRCKTYCIFNNWLYTGPTGQLTHLLREAQSHWPPFCSPFCLHSQLCKNDTREKLGWQEIETNISSAYENYAIFSRRKLLIVLELLHLKTEVTVSEPCDVIRVLFIQVLMQTHNVYFSQNLFSLLFI